MKFPVFGNSQSDYSVVRKFYSYWGAFASSKSFAWKDLYKANDLPNRQVRRIAEKENKKERDKAKKEFNELVRRLVAYVKRLDQRVLEEAIRQKEEDEERKKIEAEEKVIRTAEREKARAIAREEEFKRLDELDLTQLGIEVSEEEDDKEVNVFRCEVCSKNFRSEKQWQNHEKSKKHKMAIQKLRKEVSLSPELESQLSQQHIKNDISPKNTSEPDDNEPAEDQPEPEPEDTSADNQELEEDQPEPEPEDNSAENQGSDAEVNDNTPEEENNPSDEANTNNSEEDSKDQESEEESQEGEDDEGLNQFVKHKKKKKPQKPTQVLEDDRLDEIYQKFQQKSQTAAEPTPEPDNTIPAKQRRRRRAEKPKSNQEPQKTTIQFACGKCNKTFGTRNNLFSHLKATGHTQAK